MVKRQDSNLYTSSQLKVVAVSTLRYLPCVGRSMIWRARRDSNPHQRFSQALSLESAWETDILPLNYAPLKLFSTLPLHLQQHALFLLQ